MDLEQKNRELGQDGYYETTVQRPHWPPLAHDSDADVLVIGAGLAGLSCALELAERGRDVLVLDAEQVCAQASGRNGGQAIAGFACGQPWLEQHLGLADAQRLWRLSLASLARMRERMREHAIACDPTWSYVTVADSRRKASALRQEARHMRTHYGHDMVYVEGTELRSQVNSERYVAGLLDPASGHLNPLHYGLGLARAAQHQGVRLHEHSRVLDLQRVGQHWQARTPHACVRARQVVLAANCGLLWQSPRLAPALHARIMPVGTYIIATQPLSADVVNSLLPTNAAVCDNNFVLDYFRLSADRRMLFGGRVSYTTATPTRLTATMRRRMVAVFPQLAASRIDHTWGGFVDISRQRAPDWGLLDEGVYYLQGFSGHGVAATTLAATVVSQAIAGQPQDFEVFRRIRQQAFPGGPGWRLPLLLLGTSYYRLMDWLT